MESLAAGPFDFMMNLLRASPTSARRRTPAPPHLSGILPVSPRALLVPSSASRKPLPGFTGEIACRVRFLTWSSASPRPQAQAQARGHTRFVGVWWAQSPRAPLKNMLGSKTTTTLFAVHMRNRSFFPGCVCRRSAAVGLRGGFWREAQHSRPRAPVISPKSRHTSRVRAPV